MADTESKIRLSLIDDVSSKMQAIGGFTKDLSREFSEGLVSGVDKAIGGFDNFKGHADATDSKLGGLRGTIEGVGNKLAGFANHLKQAFMNGIVLKGLDLIASGLNKIKDAMIGGNAEFERYEVQFGVLLGSTAEAKKRLEELADFGAKTPFELPEVVRADKVLQGFGLHAKDTAKRFGMSGKEIRTVAGDVAAGTGASFEEIAGYIGKFSSGATGEAIARFQELGIVTRKQLSEMGLKFSKSGELLSPLDKSMTVLLAAMKQKFGGMMDAQSGTFEGMMSNLQDWFGQAGRLIGQPIFDKLKEKLASVLTFLGSEQVKTALTTFATTLAGGIEKVFPFVEKLVGAFQLIFAGGYGADTGVFTLVQTLAQAFGYSSTEASAFGKQAIEIFHNVTAAVSDLVGDVVDGFNEGGISGAIANFVGRLGEMLGVSSETMRGVADSIYTFLSGIGPFISTVVVPAIQKIVEVGKQVVDYIIAHWPEISTTISDVFGAVVTFIQTIVIPIASFLIDTLAGVISFIVSRWPQISEVMSQVFGAIKAAVDFALPYLSKAFQIAFAAIKTVITVAVGIWKSLVGDALDILTNKSGNKLEEVKKFFVEKFEAVKTYLSGLGGALWKLGENAIIGLINGIKAKIAPLVQAFEKVATDPVQAFKDMMGIHSPSTVMYEAGQNTMQGLIDGMGGMSVQAYALMQTVAQKMTDAMQVAPPNYNNVVAALDEHERHATQTTNAIAQQYDNVVAELDAHERHAAAVLYGEMQKTAAASQAIAQQSAPATATGTSTLTGSGAGINQTINLTFQVGDDTLAQKVIQIVNGVLQTEQARYGTA